MIVFFLTLAIGVCFGIQIGVTLCMLIQLLGLKTEFWVTRYLKKRFPSTFNL